MAEFPQDFVWEPCSDWGRKIKADREKAAQEKKPVLVVKRFTPTTPEEIEEARQRRLRMRRESARKKYCRKTPQRFCEKCKRGLHANNKHGYCQHCMTKAVRKYGKPYECKVCACGVRLGNRNKDGNCPKCREAKMRPITYCTRCQKPLHRRNRSGLCVQHSGIARQQSYRARRKAA